MTTIDLRKVKYVFDMNNNTYSISEKEVPFATSYEIIDGKDIKMLFEFSHSTGAEFDPNTKWIYWNVAENIKLEVCNDAVMTKAAAESYLDHKLHKEARYILNLLDSKQVQIFDDAADYGIPIKSEDDNVFNLVKQLRNEEEIEDDKTIRFGTDGEWVTRSFKIPVLNAEISYTRQSFSRSLHGAIIGILSIYIKK